MAQISRAASFRPGDELPRILEDLACPACGCQDPGVARTWSADNRIRVFCEGCGAFITILLSDEQADTLHRQSMLRSSVAERR